jgi:hypothetical protein
MKDDNLNNSNLPKDMISGEMSDADKNDLNNANMPKKLGFKDFMVVDASYTGNEYLAYQAQKRHRGTVGESVEEVDEVLSHAQRIKAGLRMKKMSKRIGVARKRAMKRTPTMDVFKKRANRQARRDMFKVLTRGQSKGDVSIAKRADIEKRLDRIKPRIQRMAQRMLPTIRKKDRDRKNSSGSEKK